ncbi:MAG: MarR family transcriptional regulator [Actinomycetota bacterium]|nr:MarR family transcriptional regulator [Actinomycetota bacterium]
MSGAIERMAGVMVASGMQRMAARTFAAVLCSEEGSLTAAEIAQLLQASPAAVSGSVRYLEQVEMIRRSRRPGSRRDVFLLGDDVWYEAFAHRDGVLRAWQQSMMDAAEVLGRDTAAGRRLTESEAFFAFIRVEMPGMIDRWTQQRERLRAV